MLICLVLSMPACREIGKEAITTLSQTQSTIQSTTTVSTDKTTLTEPNEKDPVISTTGKITTEGVDDGPVTSAEGVEKPVTSQLNTSVTPTTAPITVMTTTKKTQFVPTVPEQDYNVLEITKDYEKSLIMYMLHDGVLYEKASALGGGYAQISADSAIVVTGESEHWYCFRPADALAYV